MLDLNRLYIATAITDNEYKDIVKILASSFTRFNPGLILNIYCLNFTPEAYSTYANSFNIPNVILHRVTYTNPYTDPNNSNYYMTILDSIGVKFKIASLNPDCDYMLWLDADTFFCKPLTPVSRVVTRPYVYGLPRNRNVPASRLLYNAGVLFLPKRILSGMLSNYNTYCDAVHANHAPVLSYSDEYFIRDVYLEKGILPNLYNSTPADYNDTAVIQHITGDIVPWRVRVEFIYGTDRVSNATRRLYTKWMEAYNNVKPLLSRSFVEMVGR